MTKQEILSRLDIKAYYSSEFPSIKTNSGMGQALCPFHDDHKASLSVNLKTGLFKCFGCDRKGSIFDFYMAKHDVDYRSSFDALAKEAGLTTEPQRKVVKTYDYTDESGNLLSQVIRYEPKDFRQRRPDGKGEWTYNLKDVRLVPYNLPEIIKAEDGIIVEGETDVENLRAIGLVATCNPMGAGKWKAEYSEHFRGKKVAIIPDNDKPGRDHALQVARSLRGIAKSVKILELPSLPEKGDVSDWLALGHSKEELIEIIKTTHEWIPEEPKSLLDSLLRWNDILSLDVRTEYLLENLIPKGSITLLFGRGGIGKTSVAMQIAHRVAEGLPFGNLQTIKIPVYFVDFENPLAILKERVGKIGRSDNLYVWHISNEILQPPRLDSKEWELYKELPPGLLVFDTLRASHLSDENDSKPMALIMARLKELREKGFTIFLLHHTPKGNEGIFKGSTAILDLADHVLGLEEIKESDSVEFDINNLYRLGVRIKTRYDPHHIFLRFNPNIKGFEIAKDPDTEKIEAIYEILKESPEGLKQKEFKEKVKNELDLTESQIRKLLKKGENIAWDIQKGGEKKRALIYIPKSNRIIGQPIYSHPINQLNPDEDKTLSDYTLPHTTQSLDSPNLDNRIDSENPINQLEIIDLEHEQLEIIE
ncbi:MAG: AAA family ATPase [bacterium]